MNFFFHYLLSIYKNDVDFSLNKYQHTTRCRVLCSKLETYYSLLWVPYLRWMSYCCDLNALLEDDGNAWMASFHQRLLESHQNHNWRVPDVHCLLSQGQWPKLVKGLLNVLLRWVRVDWVWPGKTILRRPRRNRPDRDDDDDESQTTFTGAATPSSEQP